MDISILGPLVACANGLNIAPSAPKPRQLLALLAARADQLVSTGTLIDEVWEGRPPATAVTVIQTYIVQLRRALAGALRISTGEVAGTVLPYIGCGYRLSAGQGSNDVVTFLQCAEAGRRALANGQTAQALLSLRLALQLWRGPALADVRIGPHLLAHRTDLERCRMQALENRITADLRLGNHHELICELAGLVLHYPVNENLHSFFMIALYRSGRPAQALGAFTHLRTNLRRELGVEPSQQVRSLQNALLAADPALEAGPRSRLFQLQLRPAVERAG